MTNNTVKFILNGCDISFGAEAPDDMTVKQLVEQASRIKPNWCACGICKADESDEVEIIFDYNNMITVGDDINCTIKES